MSTAPKGSLKTRIFKAGGWHIFQILISNGMRLTSNLVMTRLLAPEAFGLMSFLMVIVTAFTLLSDIGIQRSIIRDKDGDTARYLRGAWVVQIWRGGLIAIGILTSAFCVGIFAPSAGPNETVYAHPLLPWMLAAIAGVPLIDAFKSTNWYLAQRTFQNGRLAVVELVGQMVGIILQILVALAWPSPWSLVIGITIGQVLRSALSHVVFTGPRMSWSPDPEIASRIWNFGKYLMVSSALTFVATNADKFILASIFDSTDFGLYAIAMIWISTGGMIINRLGDQIGFSAIGEIIRTRPHEAARLYKKFQMALDFICIFAFTMGFFFAAPFIYLLYPEGYHAAGHYLNLLSICFLSIRFNSIKMFILNNGNSRAFMYISAIQAIGIVVLMPLGYHFLGIEGALLAKGLNPLVSTPYTIWLIRPLLGSRYALRQIAWVIATFFAAGAAYIAY